MWPQKRADGMLPVNNCQLYQIREHHYWDFPRGASGKEPACKCRLGVRDTGLIPGLGRSPGEGNDNPLQYSCLENSIDSGAWWATVHWVAKESDMTEWLTFTLSLSLFSFKSVPFGDKELETINERTEFPKLLPAAATIIYVRAGGLVGLSGLPEWKRKRIQGLLSFWHNHHLKTWLLSVAQEPTMPLHCLQCLSLKRCDFWNIYLFDCIRS